MHLECPSKVGLVQEVRARARELPEKIIKQIGDYGDVGRSDCTARTDHVALTAQDILAIRGSFGETGDACLICRVARRI